MVTYQEFSHQVNTKQVILKNKDKSGFVTFFSVSKYTSCTFIVHVLGKIIKIQGNLKIFIICENHMR